MPWSQKYFFWIFFYLGNIFWVGEGEETWKKKNEERAKGTAQKCGSPWRWNF